MDNYAYATYIDKKDFLPGLQGLYYSLIATKTKYDLIILYCDEITENDIWRYIDKTQVILYPILNNYKLNEKGKIGDDLKNLLDISNDGTGKDFWDVAYYTTQYSNTFNPLYIFNLTDYDAILYLHCDVLVLENCDHIFKVDKKINIAYCNIFYFNLNCKYADASYLLFYPNKEVWNFILKYKNHILNMNNVHNLDGFFGNFLMKYFPVGQIAYNYNQISLYHCTGAIKYWKIFNINIKKIIENDIFWNKNKYIITNIFKEKINSLKNNNNKMQEYKYVINTKFTNKIKKEMEES